MLEPIIIPLINMMRVRIHANETILYALLLEYSSADKFIDRPLSDGGPKAVGAGKSNYVKRNSQKGNQWGGNCGGNLQAYMHRIKNTAKKGDISINAH